MSNFIYSVKDFFNTTNGCLAENGVKGFYIGPYQRGYKWKSSNVNDHIPVLLMDLYEAFKKSQNGKISQEYYLQYITVKKTSEEVFEVIDGQQRLTTLSLLFNILEHTGITAENITQTKDGYLVEYSRYQNSETNIFDIIKNHFDDKDIDPKQLKEQDKYYMLKASKCIHSFFQLFEKDRQQLDDFIQFIKCDVKLILNKEDELTSSEEIFSSLNDNKVPLTNAYLIKGLLLTKASRVLNNHHKGFKEIMDERTIMGRTWDEMNSWFSIPEVAQFYFSSEKEGMENFLRLITFDEKKKVEIIQKFKDQLFEDKNHITASYALFNKFHENIITAEESSKYLIEIKKIYKRLKSWYYDREIYNLIGYHKGVKHSNYNLSSLLQFNSNEDLLIILKEKVLEKISLPESGKKLCYGNRNQTQDVLLAINVFPLTSTSKFLDYKFDFYSYESQKWSLEHIFPRNPENGNLNVKDDLDWILKKLKEKKSESSEGGNWQTLMDVINNNPEEVEPDKLDFLFSEIKDVDDLGNMALLSGSVNSSLSNGFFNTKRKILLNRINRGSFVPKHTLDAFSKMLELRKEDLGANQQIKFGNSLTIWNQDDIEAHRLWIHNTISNLKIAFKDEDR